MIDPATPPIKALSVRQPWAWAIIHGGKPVENRSQGAVRHMNFSGIGRLGIHASKGMTRAEYEDARDFMESIGVACPAAADLLRGGLIGTVAVLSVVGTHPSPWFFGPRGILLEDPRACEFEGGPGALGLFEWRRAVGKGPEQPARWMLPNAAPPREPEGSVERTLFHRGDL